MPNRNYAARIYAGIRRRNPEPFGGHWESVGYYVGEGIWADPEYVGMPGEAEFSPLRGEAPSHQRLQNAPGSTLGRLA